MKFDILSEYCFVNMGQSPASETYNNNADGLPFYQGNADFGEIHPQTRIWCSAPVKIANKGDLLISVRAPIGALNIATEQCCIGRGLAALTPKLDKCRIKYIYFAIQSQINFLIANGTGSTFKAVNKNTLENLLIPVSSLNKQDEIVNIFEKLNNIINKRKEQLLLMDNAVKSRFIEMFGDAQVNPRNFTIMPWEKVFFTTTGKLDSNAMVEDGQYPFFTCAKEIFKIDTYAFDCEALLLAGNNAAGIYDVKYYKGKFNAYQRTYVLRLTNSRWSYQLFKKQLEDKLLYLQTKSKGTNTRYLTMGILKELQFLVPPIILQNEFAYFVEQTDKSKLEIQKSLDKLEILKKSLMQQYFG